MLLFESIVFLTTIFYGVRGVKATVILAQVRQNFGPKPIMGLLLRDSVFYFLIVVCCVPIQAIVNTGLGLSLMSVTITRMLLRLCKRAKEGLTMPRTQDMELESFRVTNPIEEVSIASDAGIGLSRRDAARDMIRRVEIDLELNSPTTRIDIGTIHETKACDTPCSAPSPPTSAPVLDPRGKQSYNTIYILPDVSFGLDCMSWLRIIRDP
ncbi:hypothetical protein ARMGADRAFT_1085850 [Armillaria gallica]|uniref:Uncharacterized protein n=1 Tax=Armillaria gallica TaxID=47427 RepID=A0A2H3D8D7_ARMGA|nr:hypothetical protein ARMGADRAFT_1085850 [Armillaria gallica]